MSRFKGFGTLFGIELKLNVRDMNMVVFAIAMPLVVLAVLGICVAPFLNLGAHYLLYKGTAALAATAVSTLAGVVFCKVMDGKR